MRLEDDETYPEMKETIGKFFKAMDENDTAEDITDWITEDLNWWFQGTSKDLRILAMGVEEVKRGILERRVLVELSAIIPGYEAGHYNRDITNEDNEDKVISDDIEYIKSNVELIDIDKIEMAVFDKDGNEVGRKPLEW